MGQAMRTTMATTNSDAAAVGYGVYVLADYSPAGAFHHLDDRPLLVRFYDWRLVRSMYSYVARLARAELVKPATESCDLLSIVGGGIEFSTPGIRAWFVPDRPPAVSGIGLGDGLLLAEEEADRLGLGEEMDLEAAVIEVRDDGMLVIEDECGFAVIDLTALVRTGDPRNRA